MKRTAPDRMANQPKPVERIEVTEGHVKRRTVLLIIALAVAVGAFVYAMSTLMRVDTGWREITVSSREMHCGQDFAFTYYLGASGMSAPAESRAVTKLYTQATVDAYRIFNSRESFDGIGNLYTINGSINQAVQVHPALYKALETLEKSGSRHLYLAPLYEDYNSLFFCNEDWETEGFDPYQNEDVRLYMAQAAAFARDPEEISLELLGDNTVLLRVSEGYQAFARENGVTAYLHLYWMQDAFIIDYLADALEAQGFTRGALSSYDGFVRCLSESQIGYSYSFFDSTVSGVLTKAARLSYPGGTNLVHLRAFPLDEQKELYFYRFEDGSVRTAYVDPADGLSKAAAPALVAVSTEKGCAETLLSVLPYYAADTLDTAALDALSSAGVYAIYCREGRITCGSPNVTLDQLAEGYTVVRP